MKRNRPLSLVPAVSAAIMLLLLTTFALAGCGLSEPERTERPAKPPSASPDGSAPAIGMDLRYLDDDGTVKTVRVEDLNR